jgi:hypothetical protein
MGHATIGVGEGHRLRILRELKFPHSVGLLYSAFTYLAAGVWRVPVIGRTVFPSPPTLKTPL